MAVDREIIYNARDNRIDLLLKTSGSVQSLSAVTHVAIVFSGVTYSSVTYSGYFDWTSGTTGELRLQNFGHFGIAPGKYDAEVILYDPSNASGVYWGEIPIRVKG